MKVLLRADAGITQGTGHVMRCLTLAESLRERGHSVELMGNIADVGWLQSHIDSIEMEVHSCPAHSLDIGRIRRIEADWVVVDSYEISAGEISELNRVVPCLAIVDGEARSIEATLYLDQNLGAGDQMWTSQVSGEVLAGSDYCLVREDVLRHRKPSPWEITNSLPTVTVFLGGTDPDGAIVDVARSLAQADLHARMVLVCAPTFRSRVTEVMQDQRDVSIIMPTEELPDLLGASDVIVSAAGTSAWDICTLAIPAVLIATVENQQDSLRRVEQAHLVLGIDTYENGRASLGGVGALVRRLLTDTELRRELSTRCRNLFDGGGKVRVVEELERRSK